MMKRLLYKGEPVLTFKMIDELHKRVEDTARKTFYRNIDRFKIGKHYIKTTDQCDIDEFIGNNELLTINTDEPVRLTDMINEGTSPVAIERILIKHHGYLLLVKPFNDELSWNVQEALIDDYFNIKQLLTSQQVLISYDQRVEALQLEFDKKEARFQRNIDSSTREINKLIGRLSRYESEHENFIPMIKAFAQYGQGIRLDVFKQYLKKVKWVTQTRIVDGKKITDVYTVDLKEEISRFISQCIVINAKEGVYKHWSIKKWFVLRVNGK